MFKISSFAIIFSDNNEILLCHRKDYDLWNLPGGAAENEELPNETVIRETKEETGYEITIDELVGIYGKKNKNEIIFTFKSHIISGKFRETDETDKCNFFSLDKIPINTTPKHIERILDTLKNDKFLIKRHKAKSTKAYILELQKKTCIKKNVNINKFIIE